MHQHNVYAECDSDNTVNVSKGTLTLWQREDLLSFLVNGSVHEMVIGSRFEVDWGSAVSVAEVRLCAEVLVHLCVYECACVVA